MTNRFLDGYIFSEKEDMELLNLTPSIQKQMKMVYSILCNLKKCTIFELQKLTKFRDVDLCLALGYLLQNNQIYQKRIDNMVYYGVVAK